MPRSFKSSSLLKNKLTSSSQKANYLTSWWDLIMQENSPQTRDDTIIIFVLQHTKVFLNLPVTHRNISALPKLERLCPDLTVVTQSFLTHKGNLKSYSLNWTWLVSEQDLHSLSVPIKNEFPTKEPTALIPWEVESTPICTSMKG